MFNSRSLTNKCDTKSKLIRKISTKVVFEEGKTEEAIGNFEDDEKVANKARNFPGQPTSNKLQAKFQKMIN